MTADEINNVAIPHLAGQFERGLPILFTGSGFSTSVKNVAGQPVRLVTDLKRSMWDICFPGKDFLESASPTEGYLAVGTRRGHSVGNICRLAKKRWKIIPNSAWSPDQTLVLDDRPCP